MSHRGRTRTHGILEWVYDFETVATAGTTLNQPLDLDLMPDEVAEIWSIESSVTVSGLTGADNVILAGMSLSMDPTNVASPISETNLKDLEVFYAHIARWELELTTSGMIAENLQSYKSWYASPKPILVGTNVGMASNFTEVAAVGDVFTSARLYFSRRRASVQELNQILLKRR